MIQHKFDIIFDSYWWSSFINWTTISIEDDSDDGTTETDLSSMIVRFVDIHSVYISETQNIVPILNTRINPNTIKGSVPQYFSSFNDPEKVLRVWPGNINCSLDIKYRTKPAMFTLDDEVPFDAQALILGATYDYLEDDGANPGAIEKFHNMFEARVKQLKLLETQQAFSLYNSPVKIPTTWS
jgi:hypothetical protein